MKSARTWNVEHYFVSLNKIVHIFGLKIIIFKMDLRTSWYRVARRSKSYPIVIRIIMQRLKSIKDNSKITIRRTDWRSLQKSFAFNIVKVRKKKYLHFTSIFRKVTHKRYLFYWKNLREFSQFYLFRLLKILEGF